MHTHTHTVISNISPVLSYGISLTCFNRAGCAGSDCNTSHTAADKSNVTPAAPEGEGSKGRGGEGGNEIGQGLRERMKKAKRQRGKGSEIQNKKQN